MAPRYRIRKLNLTVKHPWTLQVNGWDFDSFRTQQEAMSFLIRHWFCGCLELGITKFHIPD